MNNESRGEFLDLLRVVLAEPQTGDAIRILALEMYADGFALRWALPTGAGPLPETAEEAGLNPMGLMSLTVRDDLETEYESAGMFGGTLGGVSYYRPAIPAQASWLEVLVRDGFVRFDLPLAEGAGRRAERPARNRGSNVELCCAPLCAF